MVKNYFSLLLIFFPFIFSSQNIKIEGTICQPTDNFVRAYIMVNDTINKLSKSNSAQSDLREKLFNDGKLITLSDDKGKFTIFANKLSDTISFRYGRLFYEEKHAVSDLLRLKKIEIHPKAFPCITNKKCDQKKPEQLFAFVGTKIKVSHVDTSKYCDFLMDAKLIGDYEIKQEFSNNYPSPTIQFTAYDHASLPKYFFPNYENILIFIGEYCKDLYHIKYEFYPVYKTVDGKWAALIDPKKEAIEKLNITPQKIDFEKSVSFDVPDLTPQQLESRFPEQYYKIIEKKAYPIMGIYAGDLAKVKLDKIKSATD